MALRSLLRGGGAAVLAASLFLPQAAAGQEAAVPSGRAALEASGGWSLSSLWDLFSCLFLEDESDNRGSIDPNGVNQAAEPPDSGGDNRASIDPDG